MISRGCNNDGDNRTVKEDYRGKCVLSGKTYAYNATIVSRGVKAKIDDKQRNKIEGVLQECQRIAKDNKSSATATGVGAAIGAVTGGLLGFGISKTVVDAKDAQAKDKAVAEWQETMGEHIRCYVGGEDVGGYGDYVSFNFEDMN